MPDLSPTAFNTEVVELKSTTLWENNAQISFRAIAGVHADFPAEISLSSDFNAPAEISIPAPTLAPPTDAYGVHLSQGTVLMHWKHPTPNKVAFYEILASENQSGPYVKYQRGEFTLPRGTVTNVPMGISAYFRVRAVGNNGVTSSSIPVKQGKIEKNILVQMSVTGIVGSVVPDKAIFTSLDKTTGLVVAVAASGNITIT